MPSLGFSLLCAAILLPPSAGTTVVVPRKLTVPRLRYVAGVAMLVLLLAGNASRTWSRNQDWDTCTALWESSALALPTNEYLWWARAACGREKGESQRSQERHYRRSLEVNPDYDRALSELSKLLYTTKRYSEAEPMLSRGLALGREQLERSERRKMLVMYAELLESTGSAVNDKSRLNRAGTVAAELIRDLNASRLAVYEEDNRCDSKGAAVLPQCRN